MKKELLHAMDYSIAAFNKEKSHAVTLLHHNDTDGLSSGTILLNAFEAIGYAVDRFSLEKPYPQVLDKLFTRKEGIIIFADFAGKIAPLISEKNRQQNLVLIIDHHPAEDVEDERVHVIDGELYGLKGDRDISASTTCYLWADMLLRTFGGTLDAGSTVVAGRKLEAGAHLAALGAIGDGFFVDGGLAGVNREILNTAVDKGLVKVNTTAAGENYTIMIGSHEYAAAKLCNILDTVGGVGYYQDGPSLGIQICRSGVSEATAQYVEELKSRQDSIFLKEIQNLKANLHSTDHIQWFDVENRFRPMGVKTIGVFCNLIKDMDFLDHTKYLAGFQRVPEEVPGFGKINFNSSKVSMRVSAYLTDRIRSEKNPGLNKILPEATARIGGFSDACHRLSAATTVRVGEEEMLINEMEAVLKVQGEG
jgi:single-stranded-DNA-specific exonuclease